MGEIDDGNPYLPSNFFALTFAIFDVIFQIDIVLFNESKDCAKRKCSWSELGVGVTGEDGKYHWCSRYTKRMIIEESKFEGKYQSLYVPGDGDHNLVLKQGVAKISEDEPSGKYIFAMANCDFSGRAMIAKGPVIWRSVHGYLPGDLFVEMHFFIAMAILFFILFCWYLATMKYHEDSCTLIQSHILITITIGFSEAFFGAGDYLVWNEDGNRFLFCAYVVIMLGVVKRVFSRYILVLISLGLGTTRDELDDKDARNTYLLSAFYLTSSGCVAIIESFPQYEKVDSGAIDILTFVVACVDATFFVWILTSLRVTMNNLKKMQQTRKLKRFLNLRLVLIISVLFSIIWIALEIYFRFQERKIVYDKYEWGVKGASELNYFLVLTFVSCLWKPSPNEDKYANAMELTNMDSDDDASDNGVEANGNGCNDNPGIRLEGEEDDLRVV